jgi:hypothetical protein
MSWQVVISDPSCIQGAAVIRLIEVVCAKWLNPIIRVYHLEGSVDRQSLGPLFKEGGVPLNMFAFHLGDVKQIDWGTMLVARAQPAQFPAIVDRNHPPTLNDGLVLIRCVDGSFLDVVTSSQSSRERIARAYSSCQVRELPENELEWPE